MTIVSRPVRILIVFLVCACVGIGGWYVYQRYIGENDVVSSTPDTVTPVVTEAYAKGLTAGFEYMATTGGKQEAQDIELDKAADALSVQIGKKYGIGLEEQFKTRYRVHFDMLSAYYQAEVAKNKVEIDKQQLALTIWAGQIAEVTPGKDRKAISDLYTKYVTAMIAYAKAASANQDTSQLKNDVSANQKQLAEAVAIAMR